jgi:hypothetical protein
VPWWLVAATVLLALVAGSPPAGAQPPGAAAASPPVSPVAPVVSVVPDTPVVSAGPRGPVGPVVSAGPVTDEPAAPVADRVVVVGVAGLRWDDVSASATPQLAAAARAGSTGTLSVRSAPAVTCPSEGWLTLGAGGYAAVRDPADVDPRRGCTGRPVPAARPAGTAARVPATAALNDRLRFDARPGWLAEQLPCVAAAGPGAALAAADADGLVEHYHPAVPATAADVAGLIAECPAGVVDGGTLPETAGRPGALRRLDELVGLVRAGVPDGSVVMVLGVAETTAARSHLHVAIVEGPGFGPGWLSSASTRRAPYVQLADVAPTVVATLGHPVPDEVAGRPVTGGAPGRPLDAARAHAVLADSDTRAVGHRAVVAPCFAALGTTVVLISAALAWLLARRRRGVAVPEGTVVALRSTAVALAGVPAATFLANLVPWWRSSRPALAVTAVVALWALAVWAVALALGSRAGGSGRARGEVAAVAGVSLVVLVADVTSGARLQIDSLLGYNPLVAGRFVGFGNIAFAVLGAAAVLLAALAADGRARREALAAVALVGVPVVIVDGWPRWGADVGGVLTLVPAFAVLAMLAAGAAITPARVALAGVAGAAVAAAIGWVDYLRPVEQRSHFGRFVGTALDGGALATIERKAAASLELLLLGPHTVAAAVFTLALMWMVLRPPGTVRDAYAAHPWLRPAHQASLALAAVGLVVNDSIVAVPMVVALVVGPLTLAVCARAAGGVPDTT